MTEEKCEKSPDKKHHYESSSMQHAVMYHHCLSCAFCGKGKCISTFPDRSDKALMKLPTDEDLDGHPRGFGKTKTIDC